VGKRQSYSQLLENTRPSFVGRCVCRIMQVCRLGLQALILKKRRTRTILFLAIMMLCAGSRNHFMAMRCHCLSSSIREIVREVEGRAVDFCAFELIFFFKSYYFRDSTCNHFLAMRRWLSSFVWGIVTHWQIQGRAVGFCAPTKLLETPRISKESKFKEATGR